MKKDQPKLVLSLGRFATQRVQTAGQQAVNLARDRDRGGDDSQVTFSI